MYVRVHVLVCIYVIIIIIGGSGLHILFEEETAPTSLVFTTLENRYIYTYIYIYTYTYTNTNICIYTYTYTYTHIH